jgi:UDP-N-acetyl-D-mannosaminuronic acid dehydrogenase
VDYDKICMIGLGYIGLPTAAVFASHGKTVVGVDTNPLVVRAVNDGRIHIVEPDLDALVKQSVADGRLRAASDPESADAFIIAVPTPLDERNQPGLSYVETATRAIAPHLRAGNLVILESTCPVGTTELVEQWLSEARPDLVFPSSPAQEAEIRIAYCPERVLPGHVLRELVTNDRIIGGIRSECSAAAVELYGTFVEGDCLVTNARTAEMCKLTENSFRDVNIAFANELSLICAQQNIDVWELIALANRHPRVAILQPGPGVGGHCIAVDPWFIVSAAPEQARLIRTAREVNDGKPGWVFDQVRSMLTQISRRPPIVACLGLAFKADIDDLRESPALEIACRIASLDDVTVWAVEPNIETLPEQLAGNAELVELGRALTDADLLVLLVDHKQFRSVPRQALAGKTMLDTRGIWTA